MPGVSVVTGAKLLTLAKWLLIKRDPELLGQGNGLRRGLQTYGEDHHIEFFVDDLPCFTSRTG